MKHHWQITVCLRGQPAEQPVGTGDHSIANHCFIQLPSLFVDLELNITENIVFTVSYGWGLNMSVIYNESELFSQEKYTNFIFHRPIYFYSERLLSYRGISSYN